MTPSTCVASTIQEGCTPPIRLNVNLDAGLLLFWTLVYCCFGRLFDVVLDGVLCHMATACGRRLWRHFQLAIG